MITPFSILHQSQKTWTISSKSSKRLAFAVLERRGEQFVTDCRNERTYQNQSGNLRSSIGYFIFKGSEKIVESFAGQFWRRCTWLKTLIRQYVKEPNTIYLIVAGTNYAAAGSLKDMQCYFESIASYRIAYRRTSKIAKKLDLWWEVQSQYYWSWSLHYRARL